MKALVFDHFGGPETLHFEDLPTPTPRPNEIQIQIAYTSVNPVDWKLREGVLKEVLPHEFPVVPGWDLSGVVTEVGSQVTRFKVGDRVYGYARKETVHEGTYAEYICFDANELSLIPEKITFKQAAAIPLCALTAWQAFYDVGHLKKGERVLIHAGAGGVGSFAIQFAKQIGAFVITTASQKNHDYVKSLGADRAIDYTKENFVEAIEEKVDFVFDCAGGEAQTKSFEVIKPGGRLVSIVGKPDAALAQRFQVKPLFVFVRPQGKELDAISELIASGELKVPEIHEYPFEKAIEAQELNKKGHTRGKIVLKINREVSE